VGGGAGHRLDPRGGERRTVERAPGPGFAVARAQPFLAEHQVAAGEQPQIVAHLAAVVADKAGETAIMVAMRVAQDQPIELFGPQVEQVEIAQEDFRRVAEIEQVLAAAGTAARLQMQRQAPFAGEGGGLAPGDAADMLDPGEGMRLLRHELVEK
jgi:hypothetical protein